MYNASTFVEEAVRSNFTCSGLPQGIEPREAIKRLKAQDIPMNADDSRCLGAVVHPRSIYSTYGDLLFTLSTRGCPSGPRLILKFEDIALEYLRK